MTKNNYSSNVNNLIALCHIIDEFEEFQKRLVAVLSSKYCDFSKFVFDLADISKGIFKLGGSKARKFYTENKSVIDKINKYSHIILFIDHNFSLTGQPYKDLQFFYQYILNHKNEIHKILAILEKLKKLEVREIEFNTELDFTQEIHKICTLFSDNYDITYLNNLTAIPDYNPGVISYKTNNSSYKMILKIFLGGIAKPFSKIVLNDLTFNPDELPSVISKEEIFDKIISLREEKKEEYTAIKDSVTLGISIVDLYDIYNTVSSKIDKLESVEKKTELVELLLTIKEKILKMQAISNEYNKNVAETTPTISEEFLEEQKKAYIRRKEDSKLHIC